MPGGTSCGQSALAYLACHANLKENFFLLKVFNFNILSNLWLLQAMIVRGFRGDSKTHKIYFLSDSSFGMADIVSLLCLVGVTGAALLSDYFLV